MKIDRDLYMEALGTPISFFGYIIILMILVMIEGNLQLLAIPVFFANYLFSLGFLLRLNALSEKSEVKE